MTHASVPRTLGELAATFLTGIAVVVSISPIDVLVIPESPTLKYMVNVKTPLEWMVRQS